jgi:hypothetical protein
LEVVSTSPALKVRREEAMMNLEPTDMLKVGNRFGLVKLQAGSGGKHEPLIKQQIPNL